MTKYVDMAKTLAAEIQETEAHLANLRSALMGLKPLVQGSPEGKARALGLARNNVVEAPMRVVDSDATGDGVIDVLPRKAHGGRRTVAKTGRKRASAVKITAAKPTTKSVAPKAGRKTRVLLAGVPTTGTEFWKERIGKGKYSTKVLVERAMKKLKLPETDIEARKVLKNRLGAWLTHAKDIQEVVPDGKNRAGATTYRLG